MINRFGSIFSVVSRCSYRVAVVELDGWCKEFQLRFVCFLLLFVLLSWLHLNEVSYCRYHHFNQPDYCAVCITHDCWALLKAI